MATLDDITAMITVVRITKDTVRYQTHKTDNAGTVNLIHDVIFVVWPDHWMGWVGS